MSSKHTTVELVLSHMADAGWVVAQKMFGEYGVYCDGRIVGLICDDQLFIKPTPAGITLLEQEGSVQWKSPYPGAKPYLWIPESRWQERQWLSHLVKISTTSLAAQPSGSRRSRSRE